MRAVLSEALAWVHMLGCPWHGTDGRNDGDTEGDHACAGLCAVRVGR